MPTISSGYSRRQPCVPRRPMLGGLSVPWIAYSDQPSLSTCVPKGLSGPGGTTLGNGLPSAACSLWIAAVGVQAGASVLETILVLPSMTRGIRLETRPAVKQVVSHHGPKAGHMGWRRDHSLDCQGHAL